MEPLVSIIIPVYNAATLLARCIDTVRRQRYSALEILLINDGSTDASQKICDMYARVDPRITVEERENSGVSATRNHAIELARGKYLQFVDSDDWLDENATRLLVERAEECAADLVIAHYCRVDGDKVSVHGFLTQSGVIPKKQFAEHLMDEPASFYYGVMWNKLYRRDLVLQYGVRCNEELSWCEDFLFNLEYIRYAERFCVLRTPIYYYYKNDKSLTATTLNPINTMTTRLSLFEYYKDFYQSIGLYDQYKFQIHKYLISDARNG